MKQIRTLLLLVSLLLLPTVFAHADGLTLFNSETQAQQHCPNDTVVWLNTATGVYHFAGQRWYGATKNGAFVCQQEANQTGDRATRNGQ